MADHGTVFKSRFKLMRERVAAMRAIWTEAEPEYHGELVDFPKMRTWPKPVQQPHPPVIVGGAFPHAARRALAYGDGWVPHAGRPQYADVTDFLPQFQQMAAAAGRDPRPSAGDGFRGRRGSGPAKTLPRPRHRPRRGQPALGQGRRNPAAARPLGRPDPPRRIRSRKTKVGRISVAQSTDRA